MKTDFQLSISRRVVSLFEAKGYGQKHIANLLKTTESNISHKGQSTYTHRYSLSELYTICSYLKISIAEFFLDSPLEGKNYTKAEVNDIINSIITNIIRYEQKSH